MRFKRLDLNLLVVLDALLRECSVTRAARELNLSQPAMSAALARLREYFNDDILVAEGRRMVPTAHARNLAPMVARALTDIESLIVVAAVFDPATSERNFRICASDYVAVVLLQPLLAEIEKTAPGISVEILPPSADALPMLDRSEIDFLLTPEQFAAPEHPRQLLFEETHVVVGCRKNPLLRQAVITEGQFFEQGHVIMALGHTQAFAEREMGELNRRRRIEVSCDSFLAVPWMLPNTNRLAVMHQRLARLMVKQLPLAMAPLPFRLPVMREIVQYNSARVGDGGIHWLLQGILRHAAALREQSA